MKHLFDDIIVVNNRINIKEKIINPIFICVISHTETSKIPGLTIAGANSDLIQQTPSADAEFLYYGKCICIKGVPATPDGKPTPAIITRTALNIAGIPFLVVDAGVDLSVISHSCVLSGGSDGIVPSSLIVVHNHGCHRSGGVLRDQRNGGIVHSDGPGGAWRRVCAPSGVLGGIQRRSGVAASRYSTALPRLRSL